ncbi:MAG: 50S ribosomal protein L21 [Candidatus Hydrogenedens sp.]|nr:50S ribosomal protein L21 [Candidatus Hydrogenedens sp.]
MYAVVTTGGKQYRVSEGDVLRVEKIDQEVGATVEFAKVNMVSTEGGVVVDPAALESAKVQAQVLEHGRRKKIRVFKYKRRKNFRKTIGHRQYYTQIKITAIQA